MFRLSVHHRDVPRHGTPESGPEWGLAPGSAWSFPHGPGWHGWEEGSRPPNQAPAGPLLVYGVLRRRQREGKDSRGGGRQVGLGKLSCLLLSRRHKSCVVRGTWYVVLLPEPSYIPMYLLHLCLLSIEREEDTSAFLAFPPRVHCFPHFAMLMLQLCSVSPLFA
ncbi:hypothetical protein CGRA01v4_06298 [Colletotrichum graminicola]|nr:hypothetical protein CGRA01v4_06298 [Colletotrichum graminicola]